MSTTNRVDVGTPSVSLSGWTTTEVGFHGFANLTTTRNESVESPKFSCFGHQWLLALYPGGHANSPEGYFAVSIVNLSDTSIKIQYGYSVRDAADGKEVVHKKPLTKEFAACGSEEGNAWTIDNFAKRSTLIDVLVQGALVIEIRMMLPSTGKSITQFIPSNPINKNVLQKFMHEETADVVFEVNGSGKSDEHTNKKTKSTTTLYAHSFILQDISTMLSELCKSDGGITTVSITDVKPEIFRHMLYNAYGGKLSNEELKNNAKDIINACDKYGVVHLKLQAEASYVESTEITIENMMDNLLYADSRNLALLKESVMDYIVANKHSIIGKVSFSSVPGDLVTDVLTAVARGEQPETEDETIKYNKMRVGTLRKMLDDKGLDVDGSREAMIALLREKSA